MAFKKLFLDHPASVDETYLEHARCASRFGMTLLKAAGAAFVHAAVPSLCETTASSTVKALCDEMTSRRALAEANLADSTITPLKDPSQAA